MSFDKKRYNTNSTYVTCDNGHVYDMTDAIGPPEQAASISWCPKIVNDAECGARVVWINPASSIHIDK